MKKLLTFAALAALAFPVFADDDSAEETVETEALATVEVETPRKTAGVWPAFFAIGEIPSAEIAPDLIGLRLTIPCSTSQETVTGIDVGFWGRAQTYEGLMVNILRNRVDDQLSGFQVGLYNSADRADALGIQVGLWNEAGSILGAQVGLVNAAGQVNGLQVGLINRCEEMYGIQVGLVNVIRDSELTFFPLVNVGF